MPKTDDYTAWKTYGNPCEHEFTRSGMCPHLQYLTVRGENQKMRFPGWFFVPDNVVVAKRLIDG